jgi:hypothetical protein
MSKVIADIVQWFDNEASQIAHACRIAAESNLRNADEIEEAAPAVSKVLRESAASWQRKANEIDALYERVADSDLEYAEMVGRGY